MECIICFEEITKNVNKVLILQECTCIINSIHESCLVEWVNKTGFCPYCHKQMIVKTQPIELKPQPIELKPQPIESKKFCIIL